MVPCASIVMKRELKKGCPFYPAQSLDWLGQCVVFQSVNECVGNHFSPHPPPYIELSFSSSLCWYIYSPQTSQIQAPEEGTV